MVHRCSNCPGLIAAKVYLKRQLGLLTGSEERSNQSILEHNTQQNETSDLDCDDPESNEMLDDLVSFKQWTLADRTELATQTLPLGDFLTRLLHKVDNLTAHSFIAKAQAQHLKSCKENLVEGSFIALLDFAENSNFIIQDEVQSYHWNQQSCTLHPVVLCQKINGIVKEESLCFISGDLGHDVFFVYQVIKATSEYIKNELCSSVHEIHYFSDGCSGQYKNCKHFLNLCLHYNDFKVHGMWTFFATSHGKSPCHGIGGTIKGLITRASLQRPLDSQLLSAKDVYRFCRDQVSKIKALFLNKNDIEATHRELSDQLSCACTLPGTRGYHHFEPKSRSVIAAKRVSSDTNFDIKFDLLLGKEKSQADLPSIKKSDFLCCIYDGQCWIGIADEVDEECKDIKVKFMYPKFPASSFIWPYMEDVCYVPDIHVISKIQPPSTINGRTYFIEKADYKIL